MRLSRRSLRRADGTPVLGLDCALSAIGASLRKPQILLNVYPGRSDQKGASTDSRRVNSPHIFIVCAPRTLLNTSLTAYVHWSKPLNEPIPYPVIPPMLPVPLKLICGSP